MTMEEKARALGKSRNFFATMKNSNIVKYNYIAKLDKDMFKAYGKYMIMNRRIMSGLIDMYYCLSEEDGMLLKLGRLCEEGKIYANANSIYAIKLQIFTTREELDFAVYLKGQQILKIYGEMNE